MSRGRAMTTSAVRQRHQKCMDSHRFDKSADMMAAGKFKDARRHRKLERPRHTGTKLKNRCEPAKEIYNSKYANEAERLRRRSSKPSTLSSYCSCWPIKSDQENPIVGPEFQPLLITSCRTLAHFRQQTDDLPYNQFHIWVTDCCFLNKLIDWPLQHLFFLVILACNLSRLWRRTFKPFPRRCPRNGGTLQAFLCPPPWPVHHHRWQKKKPVLEPAGVRSTTLDTLVE
jgi:hypothetical protein